MDRIEAKAVNKFNHLKQKYDQSRDTSPTFQIIDVQKVQNILLIWLDKNIDDKDVDWQKAIIELRQAVNGINLFTDDKKCVEFIESNTDSKICIILSGSLGQHIVPRIHNILQVDSIFIFCGNKQYHEQWAKDWSKIRGVFTELPPVCQAVKQAVYQCEQNTISVSFVTTTRDNLSKNSLDKLDSTFVYIQILKEILLAIEFDDGHINHFADYCHTIFADNDVELKNVNKLQKKYRKETPISWYTCESFLFPMLNRGLQVMDMDIILNMGFFISDLHREIERRHAEQFSRKSSKQTFTVFRGQGMSEAELDKVQDTLGGLISFNNFLLTSKNQQISLAIAKRFLSNKDMAGILFVITVDPVKSTTPFASTTETGFYGDKENGILFSMQTVFRIDEITAIEENSRLIQVKLTLASDKDKDLQKMTDCIREDNASNENGWFRLGLLLIKMGEFAKAQSIYEMLLERTADRSERGSIFHQLGRTKSNQGKYDEAIMLYEKALEKYKKTLSHFNLKLSMCYDDLGFVYLQMKDYSKALSYYEKAHEIRIQVHSSNDFTLVTSYKNIGNIYENMDEYPKAVPYYERALEINRQSLPSNHPDLGSSYSHIGNLYSKIGDYTKALSCQEKALEIKEQLLPANDSDLALSYSNIGLEYENVGNYRKALLYYEKDLEISKKTRPSNHPDLAGCYSNIGNVYFKMGDYRKALSYYEKDLKISKISLPPDHPDLARSYNNIGTVYGKTGEHATALPYFERTLEIRKRALPSNHPDLASSYNNMGLEYESIGDYAKAYAFYKRAVKIGEQTLPSNHPTLEQRLKNLERVKKKI